MVISPSKCLKEASYITQGPRTSIPYRLLLSSHLSILASVAYVKKAGSKQWAHILKNQRSHISLTSLTYQPSERSDFRCVPLLAIRKSDPWVSKSVSY